MIAITARPRLALLAAATITAIGCSGGDASPVEGDAPVSVQPPTLVGTGDLHAAAIKPAGTLWRWGGGTSTPAQVGTATGWTGVAYSASHACALGAGGSLWCWGYNPAGQLGDGTTDVTYAWVADPVAVTGDQGWAFVTVGSNASCAIRLDQTLWCWGSNVAGQLGDGTKTTRPTPVQVGTAADWVSVSLPLVGDRACGVRAGGTLWCWGNGVLTPTQLDPSPVWARVAVDQLHACAVRRDGTLWCWGANTYGQLGDGTLDARTTPVQVGAAAGWESVTACGSHTCAIRTDGSLWCWGLNGYGQLGDGTTEHRSSPTPIGAEATWAQVSAGSYFTCATKDDGSAWCWGSGLNYRLGNGSTSDQHAPVAVSGF